MSNGPAASSATRPRRPGALRAAGALVALALLASACGSSGTAGSAGGRSSARRSSADSASGEPSTARPDRASLLVKSSARASSGYIVARNTCRGAEVSPAISWTAGVPGALSGAKEILIIVRTIANGHLSTGWAVAGIDPAAGSIPEGRLPAGAVVGRNSAGKIGYSVCPPRRALVSMGVYALPRTLALKRGFDPETLKPQLESYATHWGSSIMFEHP